MPSFRNPKKQAEHAVKQKLEINQARHTHRDDKKIHSLGTARNYTQALTRLAKWLQENRLNDLKQLDVRTAEKYLELRGQSVGQKLLDQERQAIQLHLGINLPVIRSELTQILKSRAYTIQQVEAIARLQTEKYSLATQIATVSGLRAHELLTLQRLQERRASQHRQWSSQRFIGRSGEVYTVVGKGGLIREVLIPTQLAHQLEAKRLTNPIRINDRHIHYYQHYDIGGGKGWSNSFSAASKRLLGWSHGAHGLRHSYAQQRMVELQQNGFLYPDALAIISQELGHFRPDITEVYLR
ncbi:MAG TPA: site-specific integrase [Gammaproteobacteria bacterium]|nr:site-specific integrase [Gammaproteobacteria bacterium]